MSVLRPPRLLGLGLLLISACSTPGSRTPVDVGPAPRVPTRVEVAREVGLLLSADEAASAGAERRLVNRTGPARDDLLAYADTIATERDPRWLNVLDAQHALPALDDEARLDFLLWKGARPSRADAMKAQSGLQDLARTDPDVLIARLGRGGPGMDAVAVALAQSGTRRAVPALLERYVSPRSPLERRAAAEALTMLAGESRRPRARGSGREIAQDAAVIRAWYEEQQAVAADRGSDEGGQANG